MALATITDVEKRLGRELSPEEEEQVGVLLNDAELILTSRIPDLLSKVSEGTINQEIVVMVEANMVVRVLRNPEGYMQESDGSYSYMVQTDVASGKLEVLSNEWAMLGVRGSVFLIVPKMDIPGVDQEVYTGVA